MSTIQKVKVRLKANERMEDPANMQKNIYDVVMNWYHVNKKDYLVTPIKGQLFWFKETKTRNTQKNEIRQAPG